MQLNNRWTEVLHFVTTMVAVFVAVYFDGRIREGNLQDLAERARAAVDTEIAENAQEFEESRADIHAARCRYENIVVAKGQVDVDDLRNLGVVFTDFSTAAWQAAQLSAASRYAGYEEWISRVSEAYVLHDDYVHTRRKVYDQLANLNAWLAEQREAALDEPEELTRLARPMLGYLQILEALHEQVHQRLLSDAGSVDSRGIELESCEDAEQGNV